MNITPQALVEGIRSPANTAETLAIMGLLTRDEMWSDFIVKMIRDDNVIETRRALTFLAPLLQPRRYLEIGVRRGLSMAMVANRCPDCAITGMDLWINNYGGVANPGPEFVREELKKVGHTGLIEFISGPSQTMLPELVARKPEPYDLITVDGDHSYEGARNDLEYTLPLLCVGGLLLFDDLQIPEVMRVWNEYKAQHPQHGYLDLQKFGLLLKR
jgi:predicted O-methyltransferase YrrM